MLKVDENERISWNELFEMKDNFFGLKELQNLNK